MRKNLTFLATFLPINGTCLNGENWNLVLRTIRIQRFHGQARLPPVYMCLLQSSVLLCFPFLHPSRAPLESIVYVLMSNEYENLAVDEPRLIEFDVIMQSMSSNTTSIPDQQHTDSPQSIGVETDSDSDDWSVTQEEGEWLDDEANFHQGKSSVKTRTSHVLISCSASGY